MPTLACRQRTIGGRCQTPCLHIEQLERVIQFLRERSQEAQLELNQLRGEYLSAQENILALQTQLDLRHTDLAEADKQQKHIEEQKQDGLKEIAALQEQQEKAQKRK